MHFLYRYTFGKRVRIEYIKAVSETKGCVAGRGANCGLAILGAKSVGKIEPGREFFMAFIVAESATRAKLARSRQPRQRKARGKIAVKLDRRHIQVAVVIPDHPSVLKPGNQGPLGEHSLRE